MQKHVAGRFGEKIELGGRQLLNVRTPRWAAGGDTQFVLSAGAKIDQPPTLNRRAEAQRHDVVHVEANVEISADAGVEPMRRDDQSQRPRGRQGRANRIAMRRPGAGSAVFGTQSSSAVGRFAVTLSIVQLGEMVASSEKTRLAAWKSAATRLLIFP